MQLRGVLVLLLLSVGCYPPSGAAPGPVSPAAATAASARWPDTTSDSLESGRQLFLTKCNHCHDYPDLEKINGDDWPSILKRMGHKAQLQDEERERVLRFILAQSGHVASGG